MIILIILALFVISATTVLLYLKWLDSYWERRGCFQYRPKHKNENILLESYKAVKAKGIKYGGYVKYYRPSLLCRDLDVVKAILIKDADHFLNRGMYYDPIRDPFSANIAALENEQWKNVRSIVSPIFSSGKLKMIFPDLVAHAKIMVQVLQKCAEKEEAVEGKDIARKFGMDSMGSCTFGFEINTLGGKNQDFQNLVKNMLAMNWKKIAQHIVDRRILNFLRIRMSNPEIEKYITNIINDTLEYRKKNNIKRNDIFEYIQQMTDYEIEDGQLIKNRKLSKTQMMVQLYTFFAGGFETSSTAVSFALFVLSLNQDVQDRLRKSIRDCLNEHGELTYDALADMNYLDWTICETMRKFSPAVNLSRLCNKPFKIPNSDFVIQPGEFVTIPIQGFHMDSDFYPEPEKFIPERFSPENKAKRHPMTFLPFGDGPRNCIGSRLGLIVAKVAVASIIGNFRVTLNEKTILPIRYKKAQFLEVEGGVWVNVSKVD